MARFYAMLIEPDLFGGSALVRRWDRIGTRGQERIDLFTDDLQAISHFFSWLARSEPAATYPNRSPDL
jgi:predicted DNA-binding WGR domain protein